MKSIKKQFFILFLTGFMIGVFFYLKICKEQKLNTNMIQTLTNRILNYEINKKVYLFFLLKQRLALWVLLTLCATTLFGMIAFKLFFLWNGFCLGGMFSVYIGMWGLKGGIYVVSMLFPQLLFYIPAFTGMCILLIPLYDKMFQKKRTRYEDTLSEYMKKEKEINYYVKNIGTYLFLFMVAIIGVFSECYVNSYIVKIIVKNFY